MTENLTEALEKTPLLEGRSFWALTEKLPQKSMVYNNLGVLLGRKGHSEKAKILFERAVQADPSFEPAQHNLGILR